MQETGHNYRLNKKAPPYPAFQPRVIHQKSNISVQVLAKNELFIVNIFHFWIAVEEHWPTKADMEEAIIQRDRDHRRFKLADVDYDGLLSFDEFVNFLHPEGVKHMMTAVVRETVEDMDKNKDGKISQSEYIGKMVTVVFFMLALNFLIFCGGDGLTT